MPVTIVCLCGPAGSGKTTVANYLARAYGARLLAFATPIKDILANGFGMTRAQLYGPQKAKETVDERYRVSPRRLMNLVGDGCRATFGVDFFARQTFNRIYEGYPNSPGLVVIEDLRFLSEAEALDEWVDPVANGPGASGYIWKLDTPWREVLADPTHQSESEWESIASDHLISTNKEDLLDLYAEVDRACAKFGIVPTLHSLEAP